MTEFNKTPAYNLKVVVRETGIKPDTLRAWERRYGLPNPGRTSGGHRLYSEYDIETLKWLLERQSEGMSISRAVELWNTMQANEEDPLETQSYTASPSTPEFPHLVTGTPIKEMRTHWIKAVLAFDEEVAENLLTQSFALYPLETVCTELLQKGISEIGRLWYTGQASVQQEHFASELATRRLQALIASSPSPTRRANTITGTPPQEEHTLSSLLLTLFLRQRGWPVVYLGANVPLARLEETIKQTRSNLVAFTSMQLHTAASLNQIAQTLKTDDIPFAFGGLIFSQTPNLVNRIPGYFLGKDFSQAVEAIEHILLHNPPANPGIPLANRYITAYEHFLENQARIEAQLRQNLETLGLSYKNTSIATLHFSRDIASALSLGDINYLQSEINWLEGFIKTHNISPQVLETFISAYHQATESHLDERGQLVLDWLAKASKNIEFI
jgi:DNA-binding transcriptional MerR regulator